VKIPPGRPSVAMATRRGPGASSPRLRERAWPGLTAPMRARIGSLRRSITAGTLFRKRDAIVGDEKESGVITG